MDRCIKDGGYTVALMASAWRRTGGPSWKVWCNAMVGEPRLFSP